MSGKLIVISGPSGVGKSTVVSQLMSHNANLQFSVSATTRPMRPTDVEGVTYYFVDHATFEKMIEEEQFFEYAQFVGNYYGTPIAPIDAALAEGKDVLLDVEPVGALNIKKRRPDATLIFLAAPSFAELERRLTSRGDTPPDVVQQRLERARWDYSQGPKYDYLVVNDVVEDAVSEMEAIMNGLEIAENYRVNQRIHGLKEEL